jgi:hypothetical protein
MRATGGVFVWAIESVLLSLFGVGIISLMHTIGGTSPVALDIWAIFVILCSCVMNLALQMVVAFSSKQPVITDITESADDRPDFALMYLHKAVAQGHCCTVTLVSVLYTVSMLHSLTDLDWANAYFASAPGLVWVTGSIILAFVTVLWFTSITGSWAATAVGDSNALFCIIPTTAIVSIIFPIMNEVGINGLMVCTDAMSSTLAVLYANLALATSFAICLLDCVEFDPARILPKLMRTVGDRMPVFRIYSLIHGACVSSTLVMYWICARKVNTLTVLVILSANIIVTLVNCLAGMTIPMLWTTGTSESVTSSVDAAALTDPSGSGDVDEVADIVPEAQFNQTLFGSDRESTGTHKRGARLTTVQTRTGRREESAGQRHSEGGFHEIRQAERSGFRHTERSFLTHVAKHSEGSGAMPSPAATRKQTNWLGIDFSRLQPQANTAVPVAPRVLSLAERRIALLRLNTPTRNNEHEM